MGDPARAADQASNQRRFQRSGQPGLVAGGTTISGVARLGMHCSLHIAVAHRRAYPATEGSCLLREESAPDEPFQPFPFRSRSSLVSEAKTAVTRFAKTPPAVHREFGHLVLSANSELFQTAKQGGMDAADNNDTTNVLLSGGDSRDDPSAGRVGCMNSVEIDTDEEDEYEPLGPGPRVRNSAATKATRRCRKILHGRVPRRGSTRQSDRLATRRERSRRLVSQKLLQ